MSTTSSGATQRAMWLADFQSLINTPEGLELEVKIDWTAAKHLQASGYTPVEAVQRYLSALRVS